MCLLAVDPGGTLTAEVELLELRADKPISRLRTTITNQHGTVVVDGTGPDMDPIDPRRALARSSPAQLSEKGSAKVALWV